MLCAEIIYPNKIKARSICCEECNVKYGTKDCELLYNNFKIAYFNVNSTELPEAIRTLCHDCFFNSISYASKLEKEKEISFKIFTEKHEYIFNLEPEENQTFSGGFSSESSGPHTEELLRELLDEDDDDESSA